MRRCITETFAAYYVTDFSPHSCWMASTSKGENINVYLEEIVIPGCPKN